MIPADYIVHRGRTFKAGYIEVIQSTRTGNKNSGYSQHIRNSGHLYGRLENTLGKPYCQRKGPHLYTLHTRYIYKTKKSVLLFTTSNDTCHPIF
jgi:hypothetical protein